MFFLGWQSWLEELPLQLCEVGGGIMAETLRPPSRCASTGDALVSVLRTRILALEPIAVNAMQRGPTSRPPRALRVHAVDNLR